MVPFDVTQVGRMGGDNEDTITRSQVRNMNTPNQGKDAGRRRLER
ncbi:hypothetical protein PBI_QUASAR_32 [Gordonia phage Quasar]|nr:hypothetical protein PBI_QUASAR_32 [Gordonia phage Quasar]